ncbi:MAG: acyl-CoA synthetase [Burkholderiaceae bacterium]
MTADIISGDRRLSQAERITRSARAATALSELGVGLDDCVAMMLRNDFPFFECAAACALLGAYATPVNWHYTPEEAGYILRDCDARVLVVHADLLPAIASALPPTLTVLIAATPPEIAHAYGRADTPSPATLIGTLDHPGRLLAWEDALAQAAPWQAPPPDARGSMIYTSGTTGHPKGVRRAPMDAEAQARNALRVHEGFGIPPDCTGVVALMNGPMYHSAPNAYGLAAARNGATVVLEARFDPEELLAMVEQHRVTNMHMVPTMFVRLLRLPEEVRSRYDLSSLRHVIHGAAPCPPEVKRKMIEWWGPVIHEYYGSTENGIVTVADSAAAIERPGTVGLPLTGLSISIRDAQGERVGPGEIGEIYVHHAVRTDFTYHKRHQARVEMEFDGGLTNGDMGWLDADGFLFLADRRNDMVISGGVNIYPAEIEKVLIAHPQVIDCAVFGIPNEEFGESLIAHIEVREPHPEPAELRQYLARHLAAFKIPRQFVFEQRLPREDSGKIFKRKLREPYWAGRDRKI